MRAPNTQEYTRRDPELNEPVLNPDGTVQKFKGWRDTEFKPEPRRRPSPTATSATAGAATPPPAESLPPDAVVLELGTSACSPSTRPSSPHLPEKRSRSISTTPTRARPHDVDIRADDGTTVVQDQPTRSPGPPRSSYAYTPLEAGTYKFICSGPSDPVDDRHA